MSVALSMTHDFDPLTSKMTFRIGLSDDVESGLLPPLFGEKPAEPSAFQLSGKLITNDLDREKLESDNYLDKVEGAQLNFEFRK